MGPVVAADAVDASHREQRRLADDAQGGRHGGWEQVLRHYRRDVRGLDVRISRRWERGCLRFEGLRPRSCRVMPNDCVAL